MFSPALGRAVRSSSSISAPSVCALGRPAALGASAQQSFSRPSHQRRLSSSKASIPPDGSNANPNGSNQTPANASKAPAKKPTGRTTKKRASKPPALNVPHVPPTDYLTKTDVKIASFFSLHRPISLSSPIPPVTTNAAFDSMFMKRTPRTPRTPNDRDTLIGNIKTLSEGIEMLEATLQVPEAEGVQFDAGVQHLDGPPRLDQLMSQYVHFRPPPPPVPFDEAAEPTMSSEIAQDVMAPSSVKQRAWSTEVVVTESTDAEGKRTYSATTAPMVEISVPAAENSQEVEIRQPFLERMRQRQDTHTRNRNNSVRPDMLAISVKRQRKLKMKKHKYKKLMKRTRLLRRKLDRL